MQSMDQALLKLHRDGKITNETLVLHISDREKVKGLI